MILILASLNKENKKRKKNPNFALSPLWYICISLSGGVNALEIHLWEWVRRLHSYEKSLWNKGHKTLFSGTLKGWRKTTFLFFNSNFSLALYLLWTLRTLSIVPWILGNHHNKKCPFICLSRFENIRSFIFICVLELKLII